MQIPDQDVGWIAAAWAAIVTWLVTLERRLLARPTRIEQEAIAAKVAADVKNQFEEVKRMLERQNESATRDRQATLEHRQWVGDSLADIRIKVAVLRERVGDDSSSDTGSYRRRV